jgi:hypothetical protein
LAAGLLTLHGAANMAGGFILVQGLRLCAVGSFSSIVRWPRGSKLADHDRTTCVWHCMWPCWRLCHCSVAANPSMVACWSTNQQYQHHRHHIYHEISIITTMNLCCRLEVAVHH